VADYTAKPGHDYAYTIAALKGRPAELVPYAETAVRITTESPEAGTQEVYFNRGIELRPGGSSSPAPLSRTGSTTLPHSTRKLLFRTPRYEREIADSCSRACLYKALSGNMPDQVITL
jgi:hypothetical protein